MPGPAQRACRSRNATDPQQVTNSAGSWGGVASQSATAPAVNYVYGNYAQDASLAQAWAAYEAAASQARINARVAQMTAAYNQWLAIYLEQKRAERARKHAEEVAKVEADRKAYDARIKAEKAAAIKAATPGPVGTTVVKPPAVVALTGGSLLTNVGGKVQMPGAVWNASDGSDAPTAAAVGGAIAATGAMEVAAGGDPGEGPDGGCGNDPRKLVEDMAKEVIEDWGLSGIDKRISKAQWRHPEYIWAYRGSEIHKEVARRLGQRYPDLFDGTMNRDGPDYTVQGTGKKIELTTPGELVSRV